jgi:hypothetical protein
LLQRRLAPQPPQLCASLLTAMVATKIGWVPLQPQ